ncbi:kinesin-like protein KIF20B isoform X2 [Hypomesus transpacificus]|uniref:kinesin-like protein KIF20B isoform X2 n=1 Tax=Hypomesus transpacificus TaxID=137520 RepID=UPI001F07B892|nr:kinesin-like protein KIF20B isoform X2 [Hypomesus transpacificus]
MMDSCFNNQKPGRVGPVVVDDLKRDLFADFSAVPSMPKNSVLLEKEHLRVYLRIRPFTSAEDESGEAQDCVTMEPPDKVVLKAPSCSLSSRLSERPVSHTAQKFQFSHVYGPETTQREMFDGTVKSLVKDVLEGGNSLVFTYGVTNAGKTFTFLGPESDGGLLPRSLNVIFGSIEGHVFTQNHIKPHRCRDFTRLTKDQQEEEVTSKRNLFRLLKESDSQRSTSSLSSSNCSSLNMSDSLGEDSFCLDMDTHTKFSVWVSFCEIYNENIHDLLEPLPNGAQRRTVLRLSQDIKGNSFIKDLKWVQVNSSEEAYRIMKIGKKNQSFSSTKLNHVSSRSHSIFSIRILRIEDVGVPRVHTISELSLCDLAGSERCAKTHNRGDRLKEAGNINTSLLILGKCITALRLNQQAKFQQHVPFRESKLTHYLQGFFCGRGKACMIVNINQCASMYDETLGVLKFSAVAQKVVVVNPRPLPIVAPKRSAREVSLIINNADRSWGRRKSSLVAWETTLEDVQEDDDDDDEDDDEEDEGSCEESMAEETILEAGEGEQTAMEEDLDQCEVAELRQRLQKEEEDKLALESRIREEVTNEFMELFSKIEEDYNERLLKEREIMEERSDKRLEILRSLVSKSVNECSSVTSDLDTTKEDKVSLLEGIMETMRLDLGRIRREAEAAHTCLAEAEPAASPGVPSRLQAQVEHLSAQLLHSQQQLHLQTNEVEQMAVEKQTIQDQFQETKQSVERQMGKVQELMEICLQKDEMISKLQTAMGLTVEEATRDRELVESIRLEILELRKTCNCVRKDHDGAMRRSIEDGEMRKSESRKRSADPLEEPLHLPALKRGVAMEECVSSGPEELRRLQEECGRKDQVISQLQAQQQALQERLERMEAEAGRTSEDQKEKGELNMRVSAEAKQARVALQQTVDKLTSDLEAQTEEWEVLATSLEKERRDTARLTKENKALVNGIFQLQVTSEKAGSEVTELQAKLRLQSQTTNQLSEELANAKTLQKELEDQVRDKTKTVEALTQEVDRLKQEGEKLSKEVVRVGQEAENKVEKVSSEQKSATSGFHATMDALRKECEFAVERSAQRGRQVADLQLEVTEIKGHLCEREEECGQLRLELETQQALAQTQLNQAETQTTARALQTSTALQAEVGLLTEQLRASEASCTRGTELQRQLAEREAECTALQERLDEAKREVGRRAEEEENQQSHPGTQANERLIAGMREALSEQERTQKEQEDALEDRVREIETLTQELTSLKDGCLLKTSAAANELPGGEELLKRREEEEERARRAEALREEDRARAEERWRGEVEALGEEVRRLQQSGAEKERRLLELQEQLCLQTPEVLEMSTEGGRESRFPRPEVEIQFSTLQPNTFNLRRQGDAHSTTVKVTKRKSVEMVSVGSENRKNKRLRGTPKVNLQSPTVLRVKSEQRNQQSPASLKAKKDKTLQKIGDFLQSSPTLLGSRAKTIMGMVNGRSVDQEKPSGPHTKPKRTRRKLYKTDISSPVDILSHPIIGLDQEEKESDHLIIKRQLRSRTIKK